MTRCSIRFRTHGVVIAAWGSVRCLLTCGIYKWLTRRACVEHHGWIEGCRAVYNGESHKNRVGWQNIGDVLPRVEGNCGSWLAFLYGGVSNWSMIGMFTYRTCATVMLLAECCHDRLSVNEDFGLNIITTMLYWDNYLMLAPRIPRRI